VSVDARGKNLNRQAAKIAGGGAEKRILDFGFWILDFGFWILDFGFWILDFGFWMEKAFCSGALWSVWMGSI
jgi:hypothetical protein